MKTTKKLNLNDLKVDSFVTSIENKDSQTIKGGSSALCSFLVDVAIVYAATALFLSGAFIADTAVGTNPNKAPKKK